MGYKEDMPQQQAKGQLSPDTIATILAILQTCTDSLRSEDLVKDISLMVSQAAPLLNKSRPVQVASLPQSVIGIPTSATTAVSD